MGLKPTLSRADLRDGLREKVEIVEKVLIRRLNKLGVDCVNRARKGGSYLNQTANLRNSIGFVLYAKGMKLSADFQRTAKPKPGVKSTGVDPLKTGENYADTVARGIANEGNIVLVVVAGMNYASYVEDMDKDVLTSTQQWAEDELKRMLDELRRNVSEAMKSTN